MAEVADFTAPSSGGALVWRRFTRERLRFRAAPPSGWTVVQLSPEEATAEARAHGHPDTEGVRVYLVCPGCHSRYHLREVAQEARCEECGNTYPVHGATTA